MKITKYAHACLLLEKEDTNLLIDPGTFTELPTDLPKVDFVIVTEEHYDHLNLDNLLKVVAGNPELQIYATAAVQENLKESGLNVHAVSGSQTIQLGSTKVTFKEADHAVVYLKSPCKSLAIMIGDELYYPSDTYEVVNTPVKALALPTSGPWFKVSECITFVNAINSKIIFPTHNALNSETGNKVVNNYVANNIATERDFTYLEPGKQIEI